MRVLLIVIAFVLLGFIAVGIGAFYWLKKHGPQLATATRSVMTEGSHFGESHTDEQCIIEAISRGHADDSFRGQIKSRIFAQACLAASKPTSQLCQSVPRPTEIFRAAEWSAEECRRRGFAGDQICSGVMQAVPEHCHGSTGRPAADGAPPM